MYVIILSPSKSLSFILALLFSNYVVSINPKAYDPIKLVDLRLCLLIQLTQSVDSTSLASEITLEFCFFSSFMVQ